MIVDKKNFSIQILALIGLALSIKLALIYYTANYNQYALSSFCSINDFVDCDGAARSSYSQFLGIPLAYWGIFFYIIVLFLTVVNKLKTIKKKIVDSLKITMETDSNSKMSKQDITKKIEQLKGMMNTAASQLDFETAIKLREEIATLKKKLR